MQCLLCTTLQNKKQDDKELQPDIIMWLYGRGIFVTERCSGSSFSEGHKPQPFFPAIDIMRLGVSCYPTALLSNKLAQHPLKISMGNG
jgi:hypothetical protein